MLDETSHELADALEAATGFQAGSLLTGGGVFVLSVDLSQDGRFMGPQVWLTRDGILPDAPWLIGFYDFAADEEDEGVAAALWVRDPESVESVADAVAGILKRLRVGLIG